MSSFVIDGNGFVFCCGDNNNRDTFVKIPGRKFVTISSNGYHTMAIDEYGHLWACGLNSSGQLGLNDYVDRDTFEKVSDQKFLMVSCGENHTMAIDEYGHLWACGSNQWGQLGHKRVEPNSSDDEYGWGVSNIDKMDKLQKVSDEKFISVSCGSGYTIAIGADKYLWVCGSNFNGELGIGGDLCIYEHIEKSPHQNFKNISCGKNHTMAIDNEGYIWACGFNIYKQLGLDDNDDRYTFIKISNQTFIDVVCGNMITLALDENGYLWVWGVGEYSKPTKISNIVFSSISANNSYMSLIDKDGYLWVCGSNNYELRKIENIVCV